jgi:hypothetical protein
MEDHCIKDVLNQPSNDNEDNDRYEEAEKAVTAKLKRPACQRKGGCPNKATLILVWDLDGGPTVRFSCEKCAEDRFGSHKSCWVARLEGFNAAEEQ